MDSWFEDKLRDYVTGKRYRHSLDARDAADSLALFWGCDRLKARMAGLLHDVARDLPLDRMKRIIQSEYSSIPCENAAEHTPGLLHAHAGRVIVREDFGIEDEDILNSISHHTTGRAGMSLLEKMVFIADYIERGRTFRGVKTARRLAYRNLDETIRHKISSTLIELIRKGRPVCSDTIEAYNYYLTAREPEVV